jgi:hypothetical protein
LVSDRGAAADERISQPAESPVSRPEEREPEPIFPVVVILLLGLVEAATFLPRLLLTTEIKDLSCPLKTPHHVGRCSHGLAATFAEIPYASEKP